MKVQAPRLLPYVAALATVWLLASCGPPGPKKAPEAVKKKPASPPPLERIAIEEEPETAARPTAGPSRPAILRAKGTRIVNAKGEPVTLRGCNLGNWLLLELWMLDWSDILDQHELETILAKRFGEEQKDRLMEVYRENWITERDMTIIRSFGYNTVRLPFNYRMLEDDFKTMQLKPEAFKWLDRAIDMARRHGLYVILDMHGVPGGQSNDHTTGRRNENKLWEPLNRERTAWLWKEIAARYKDSAVVAAYDIINEPYGTWQSDDHLQPLVEVVDQIYRSIRSVDGNHIIFIPGAQQGISIYGDPKDHGWENVGFTEHYYPGLFGSELSLDTHARHMYRLIPWRAATLEEMQVPFLVGEYNVVFQQVGGPALMRAYADEYERHGWAHTMWSYKIVTKTGGLREDNWYMVTNLEPLAPLDPKTSPIEDIERYFKSFGTMPYAVFENLGAAMTMDDPPTVFLPEYAPMPVKPPAEDPTAPWTATDIGGALAGGQRVYSGNKIEIYGGGQDIWDAGDQFRFVWQEVQGEFELTATVDSLADSHMYAKAGLMLRESLEPDSPHFLINVFPDGEVLVAWRAERGMKMLQERVGGAKLPVLLRLERSGSFLEASWSENGRDWNKTRIRSSAPLRLKCHAGLAVLSHDNRVLTTAMFKNIELKRGN